MIYRNLEPLFLSRDSLKRLINNYNFLIQKQPNVPSILTTNSFIKTNIDKIDSRLNELNYYTSNKRVKRELADGLSSVLKWLIGTPDAKDAKHYDECIELLEKRQISTDDILNQQLQIISSTIKNFNETILKISYDEHILNENINKINDYFNSTRNVIFNLTIIEEINSISLQILESVLSLEQEINDIITSILFIKSGTIHPSIISTMRLYNELLISRNQRQNKNLVAPIIPNNMHQIIESSSVTSYIYMNKLVYILEFPLVRNEKFTLYRVYTVPIRHPNSLTYSTILPEQTYVATSPTRQEYTTTSSLNDCKIFTTETRVCKNLPVYNTNARPICEMAIILSTEEKLPKICEITTFSAQINTFQALRNNKWLFILHEKTTVTEECKDNIKHKEISGTGILILHPGCKVYTAFITLTADEETITNISHPIITVNIATDCIHENPDIKEESLSKIKFNNFQLDSLKSIQEEIKIQQQRINTKNKNFFLEKHSNKINILSIVIGSIMLMFFICKCCCRYPYKIMRWDSRRATDTSCIQIFNNCFDNSRRRQHIEIPIPLSSLDSSNLTEEEDESPYQTSPQRSANNAQSLF